MCEIKDLKIFTKVKKIQFLIFNQACITIRLLRHCFYNDAKSIAFSVCRFYLEIGHFCKWLRKIGRYGKELRVLSE